MTSQSYGHLRTLQPVLWSFILDSGLVHPNVNNQAVNTAISCIFQWYKRR